MKKNSKKQLKRTHECIEDGDSDSATVVEQHKKKLAKKTKKVKMYEVEVILAAKVNQQYTHDYLVKWYGYLDVENTWEPYESVQNCKRLLKSFWSSIPSDNLLQDIGHVITPSPEWITSEKIYYRTVIRAAHEEKGMNKRKKVEMVEVDVD